MNTENKIIVFFLLLALLAGNISCKKFLDVPPPKSKVLSDRVFTSDVTANAAVVAMYGKMIEMGNFSCGDEFSVTMVSGLSSDELINKRINDATMAEFNNNNLSVENAGVLSLWTSLYKVIYMSNAVIEGLAGSISISNSLKSRLGGEALFIRAFCNFYLVNLYGNVPLVSSTDYRVNALVSRTSADSVYKQIIVDLKNAKTLMNEGSADQERIRPNKAAALALLARVYLYTGNWSNAELEADSVINNTSQYRLVSLDSVFLKNSDEAIWQLSNGNTGATTGYTNEAYFFTPPVVLTRNILKPTLLDILDEGDNRKINWIGTYTIGGTIYYPYKYRQNSLNSLRTEYSMVLRLAEQYLIRAEARAHLNDIVGAKSDIDAIRGRASLDNTTASDISELLTAIEKERRIELFSEWGHRWFDLKRTGRANAVLGSIKTKWNPGDVLYPIPQQELNNNNNLYPQNDEY